MGLKKRSSDLFLRKLKCLWEYLILSLVLAAMKVNKLLNMCAVSIGSVLVV